jgi:hypothetical protein
MLHNPEVHTAETERKLDDTQRVINIRPIFKSCISNELAQVCNFVLSFGDAWYSTYNLSINDMNLLIPETVLTASWMANSSL